MSMTQCMNENRQTSLKPVRPIHRRRMKENVKYMLQWTLYLEDIKRRFSVCQKFPALPAEKHSSYTEAEGKSTDSFAVLEHDSDENKLDLCVTLLAFGQANQ